MPYEVRYTDRFKTAYLKLTKQERELFARKLRLFVQDPYDPSLRTKIIQGTELFEWGVNMDIWVILYHEGDRLVALLDIGRHSKFKKY